MINIKYPSREEWLNITSQLPPLLYKINMESMKKGFKENEDSMLQVIILDLNKMTLEVKEVVRSRKDRKLKPNVYIIDMFPTKLDYECFKDEMNIERFLDAELYQIKTYSRQRFEILKALLTRIDESFR